ncbi:hypothetical protein MTR_2g461370 [Medicago truncatula]|uniref:Uncharacterized protein n=1 Tax=Medicago truncatula TaxID=3880 RepID=A0A072VIW6_MEDTR|nr:hypothetical protein MTR_2g461370 [Medicago truncatula]
MPILYRSKKRVGLHTHTHLKLDRWGRILDGLSLGAKERDLEQIGHENMKIGRQNMSPTSQKPGTARASLGTAVPPSRRPFAAFAWTPSYSILAHNLPWNILGIYLLRF